MPDINVPTATVTVQTVELTRSIARQLEQLFITSKENVTKLKPFCRIDASIIPGGGFSQDIVLAEFEGRTIIWANGSNSLLESVYLKLPKVILVK